MRSNSPISLHGAAVLQVLPALETGGVERGTVEMAEAIARAGGTALVASAGGRMVAEVERAGGRHLTLDLRTKTPWGLWRNAALLAGLIRRERVEIVHARSRAPAWSALLACRRTGARFVTTWHGTYAETLPGKRVYNSVMARGERVIAISRFIAGLVRERHGVEEARLRIVPRGVDPARFDPAVVADRAAALARVWGLQPNRPVVMLPARLTRWKGQEVLISALARMGRGDAVAVLVGSAQGRDAYVAALRRQAASLGMADRLLLVGQCDDMPAALFLADAVVSASTEPEAFGRAVIEAQAMARPVIATDHGGAAETVAHGVTGWRVPPGDPAALAAALDRALGLSPAAREALGARARDSVLRDYTTEAMQEATLAVYREVLDERAVRGGE